MTIRRIARSFAYITFNLSILTLLSCASSQTKVSPDQFSGYLDNYQRLEKVKGTEGLRWLSPIIKSGKYSKVILEPVEVYPDGNESSLLTDVTSYFDLALSKSFSRKVPLVTQPGPDVVRLQLAITGVSSATEGMKAYEVIPVAAIIGSVKAATGTRAQITQVYMEAKVLDSQSGETVATAIRKGTGTQSQRSEISLDDVKPILDFWASEGARLAEDLVSRSGYK